MQDTARINHLSNTPPNRQGTYWFYGTLSRFDRGHNATYIITVKMGAPGTTFYYTNGQFVHPNEMQGLWFDVPMLFPVDLEGMDL